MFGVGFSMLLLMQTSYLKAGIECLRLGAAITKRVLDEQDHLTRYYRGR